MESLPQALEELLKRALAGEPVDWSVSTSEEEEASFLEYTLDNGLQPLLYFQLQRSGSLSRFPKRVNSSLSKEARRQAVDEALTLCEIKKVLSLLVKNGVESLLLKGTPIAYTHYPHPNLRPRSDLDLLVREKDRHVIRQTMEDLGYSVIEGVSGELISQQFAYRKVDAKGVEHLFDFHWRLSSTPIFASSFTFDELFQKSIPVERLGTGIRTLAPIHSLLLASVHRAAHHYNHDRLIWLYDIHLLAGTMSKADLENFATLATEKKIGALCRQTLLLAMEWFNTQIDHENVEHLFITSEQDDSAIYFKQGLNRIDLFISDIKQVHGWKKLRLIAEHLLPSPKYILNRYRTTNRLLLPFLYLHRGLAGIKKWLRPV